MKPDTLAHSAAQSIVLAVDDAPEILSLLTDILENAGMTTLISRSGENALALINRVTPDLILMDAGMPGMDGFETCRRIKSEVGLAHIPVIFMTGLTDTEHVVKGFEAGGVDYIAKPVKPDELLARIRVHLMNSRLVQGALNALDLTGVPLMAINGAGELLWMTPTSEKYFNGVNARLSAETIAAPLAEILKIKASKYPLHVSGNDTIFASYIGTSRADEFLIRLREGTAASEEDILRKHLALTAREAEVLLWITQGKSNRDVAEILNFSPRTVNKHLEQIFQKLNVENRTAAAMLAVQVLTKSQS
ncbi:MAG: response regulator [Parvibaculaceae bacterium]